MTAYVIQHFDALSYVDQSKSLGVNEEVAKHQARQMEELLKIAANNYHAENQAKELATKKDLIEAKSELRLEIQKSKLEMVMWMAGMFIASGVIQHFFK